MPDPTVIDAGRHRPGPPARWMWAVGAVVALVIAATIGALIQANLGGRGPSTLLPQPPTWRDGESVAPSAGSTPTTPPGIFVPPPVEGGTVPRDPVASRPTGPATGGPVPPPGFTLTWADTFDGRAGTGLDRRVYRYAHGSDFGTGEIGTMTDSTRNVFHDGSGHLVIRALHSGRRPTQGWTSGRFETQDATFGASRGGVLRVEASLRQPDVSRQNGAGYWPAFWMVGAGIRDGATWPRMGGVNIMEGVNGRGSVFATLHCGRVSGGPCREPAGLGSGERRCAGCQTGFHTYAVEIDRSRSPEQIRWYLDGVNYFTVNQSEVGARAWADAVHRAYFLVFDLAIGGDMPRRFGGGPDGRTVSGGALTFDYVAVYNRR